MQPGAGGWLRFLADALDCWRVYLPVLASLAGSVAILNVVPGVQAALLLSVASILAGVVAGVLWHARGRETG